VRLYGNASVIATVERWLADYTQDVKTPVFPAFFLRFRFLFSVDYIHLQADTPSMPATAKQLDVEHPMDVEAQLTLLGERTVTLQRDVTEIKSNMSRIDAKLGSTVEKVAALEPKLDGLASSFNAKLDGMKASVEAKLASLDTRIDGLTASFDAKLASLDTKLNGLAATFDAKLTSLDTKLNGLAATFDAKLTSLDTKLNGQAATFDAKLDSLDTKLNGLATSFDANLSAQGAGLEAKLEAMEKRLLKGMFRSLMTAAATVGGLCFGLAKLLS
jgi:chromosome segregation ATPase